MALIKVNVQESIYDGAEVVFVAPCDCSAISGLRLVVPNGNNQTTDVDFAFKDANGNDLSNVDHLFKAGAFVKVILKVTNKVAYIQNPDTNGYLENRLDHTVTQDISVGRRQGSSKGTGSSALGYQNTASGSYSVAEGKNTQASAEASHAEGITTGANDKGAHAEGDNSVANGQASHAEGRLTKTVGRGSHAEGDTTTAGNKDATLATNLSELATYEEQVSGAGAHAEGIGSIANKAASHAEGYKTQAKGNASHSEGQNTTATGIGSHAEGLDTVAEGNYSHAEGCSAGAMPTSADGKGSHAEGVGTWARAEGSHAEGFKTTAGKKYSHAEGQENQASGVASHTEGLLTQANGDYSHAEGENNIADGLGSHVEGLNNRAKGNYSHVQGKYNYEDNHNRYAHIVGGGTSDSNRKNIHTLDWEGNAEFAGDVIATDEEGNKISLIEILNKKINVIKGELSVTKIESYYNAYYDEVPFPSNCNFKDVASIFKSGYSIHLAVSDVGVFYCNEEIDKYEWNHLVDASSYKFSQIYSCGNFFIGVHNKGCIAFARYDDLGNWTNLGRILESSTDEIINIDTFNDFIAFGKSGNVYISLKNGDIDVWTIQENPVPVASNEYVYGGTQDYGKIYVVTTLGRVFYRLRNSEDWVLITTLPNFSSSKPGKMYYLNGKLFISTVYNVYCSETTDISSISFNISNIPITWQVQDIAYMFIYLEGSDRKSDIYSPYLIIDQRGSVRMSNDGMSWSNTLSDNYEEIGNFAISQECIGRKDIIAVGGNGIFYLSKTKKMSVEEAINDIYRLVTRLQGGPLYTQ